jgi:hypothetical protein
MAAYIASHGRPEADGTRVIRSTIAALERELRRHRIRQLGSRGKLYEVLWALQNLGVIDVVVAKHRQPVEIRLLVVSEDRRVELVVALLRVRGLKSSRLANRFCRSLEHRRAPADFLARFETIFAGVRRGARELLHPAFLAAVHVSPAPGRELSSVSVDAGDRSVKPETDPVSASVPGNDGLSPDGPEHEARSWGRIGRRETDMGHTHLPLDNHDGGWRPVVTKEASPKGRYAAPRRRRELLWHRWPCRDAVHSELKKLFHTETPIEIPDDGILRLSEDDPLPMQLVGELAKMHFIGIEKGDSHTRQFEAANGPPAVAGVLTQYYRLHAVEPDTRIVALARFLIYRITPSNNNRQRLYAGDLMTILAGYAYKRIKVIGSGKVEFTSSRHFNSVFSQKGSDDNVDSWERAELEGHKDPLTYVAALPPGACRIKRAVASRMPSDGPEAVGAIVAEFETKKSEAQAAHDDTHGVGAFDLLPMTVQIQHVLGRDEAVRFVRLNWKNGRAHDDSSYEDLQSAVDDRRAED